MQSSLHFLSHIKGIPRKGFLAFCTFPFNKAETLETSVVSHLSDNLCCAEDKAEEPLEQLNFCIHALESVNLAFSQILLKP